MSSCVVRERALGDFWLAGGEWDVFLVCFRFPRLVFFLALRFQLSIRFFLFGLDKIVQVCFLFSNARCLREGSKEIEAVSSTRKQLPEGAKYSC